MPKKSSKAGKYYFTQVHEDAVVKYAVSSSREEKTELYIMLIQPAFSEMVDKIVYTYKFSTLPTEYLELEISLSALFLLT